MTDDDKVQDVADQVADVCCGRWRRKADSE